MCVVAMSAKELIVKPVTAVEANEMVKQTHYSGKVVQNSQVHLGVYWRGDLAGAMQFGPSIDLRRMARLVSGSGIHDFMELNRMAFDSRLPRNSESRALAVAMRLFRRHAPQVRWIVTFADATQCGDGTIYRAAGFDLISVRSNTSLLRMPDGQVVAKKALDNFRTGSGRYLSSVATEKGAVPLEGFQIKYVKFLDQSWRDRLSVPVLPYSTIDDMGASMVRGSRVRSIAVDAPCIPTGGGRFDSDPDAPSHNFGV